MKTKIVDKSTPVTLVGGGAVSQEDLTAAFALAPTCIAADSGADAVLAAGLPLDAVIGDMDSISEAALGQIPPAKQHRIAEQDSTDFDKALRHISAPLVIAVGFAGRRIDHQLAALHRLAMRPEVLCLVVCAEDIVFLCPRDLQLPVPPGTRVSLFPMGAVSGRSEGLEWPIEGLRFAPDGRSGTSNRATGAVRLQMDGPAMLCILPRRFMAEVAALLARLPPSARWPARSEPRRAPPES